MTVHSERIPTAITAKLMELLKRFKHIVLLKGLALTMAVFLGAMLVAISLDRMFVIPTALRLVLSVSALAVTAVTAYVHWLRPYHRRPGDVALAATVEVEHPELQERVSSTIEFLTKDERPEYRGSEELIHAVAEQAVVSVRQVNFADVVSPERARRSSMAAAFLVLVTACIAVLWWTDFKTLLERFAMPWANIARVSSTRITVHEPGDKVVAKGESVHVAATVTPNSVGEAILYIEVEPERWVPVRMTAAEPGSFSHRLTDVTSDMRYYIRAGDGVTRRYSITAVERPKLARIDLRYDYPEYTKKKSKEELEAPGDIRGVVGTQVTLAVTSSKQVEKVRLEMTGLATPLEMRAVGARKFETKFTLASSGLYVPRFEDEYGFTNQDEEVRQVIADADAAPVVAITSPERNIKLHAATRLPVTIHAADDFAVMELAIAYHVNEGEDKELAVPVKLAGVPELTATYTWNLGGLALKPGDTILYRARATDNRPGTMPNVGFSDTHTILITSPRYDVDKTIRQKQLEDIKKTMSKLKKELETAKQQEQQMKALAEKKLLPTEAQKAFKPAAQADLQKAEPTAKQLAEMLKKDPLLEPLTPKAEEIVEKHIPEAEKATEKIDVEKPLDESETHVDKAQAEINEAIRKIDEMAKEAERLEKGEEQERKLADLAEKEKQLAAEADKVPKEEQKEGEKVAEKQDDLKAQADQMMDKEMKQEALQKGLDELKKMKEDIQNLKQQEEDLKKRTEEAMKEKLEELTRRQEELNKEAAAAKPEVQPKLDERQAGKLPEEEMKKALDDMKQEKLPEAVAEQKKAEDGMRREAKALQEPVAPQEGKPEKPAAPQQAEKMNDLARKQEEIRRELAQLAGIPQFDKELEDLLRKQEALKKEAEKLEQQAEPEVNKEKPRGEQAPREMQQALEDMKQVAPEQAVEHQEEAAEQLDQLGENLEQQAQAAQPEAARPEPPAKQLARKARELSKEQRELKQELAQHIPPPNEEMEQLAEEQTDLQEEAQELGQEMQDLAGALQQMLPDVSLQVGKAQKAMKQAPQHMQEAARDLEAAKAEEATGQEQQAVDDLNEAGEEAGKLEDQLAQAAEKGEGPPEQGAPEQGRGTPEPGQPEQGQGTPEQGAPGLELAKALSQMRNASQEMRSQQPQQGSQSMQQAAQHLAQAAQQMMTQGQPSQPNQTNIGSRTFNPTGIRGIGPKLEGFELLKTLKLTAEEWNRLPGEMKQQLLQAMKGKYPEEYRQLIRDYFTHLAKTGVKLDREE